MSGEKDEIWITGVVPAIKPPMLNSEKLAKEMLRNQSSRARVLLCVYTSLSDFMAIYTCTQVPPSSRWWSLDGDFILSW